MAEQPPPFDINVTDLETDSEYLYTPVDLPYVPLHCRSGFPTVEPHRYPFSDDVISMEDSSYYRSHFSTAGYIVPCDAQHPSELPQHMVAVVEHMYQQCSQFVDEDTPSVPAGHWVSYDSHLDHDDPLTALQSGMLYTHRLSGDYLQDGQGHYGYPDSPLSSQQYPCPEDPRYVPAVLMAASEDPEAPEPECYSPVSECQHPQHTFASYHGSVSYIRTGRRRPDSPIYSESHLHTAYVSEYPLDRFPDNSSHPMLYSASPCQDDCHASDPSAHDTSRSRSESPTCPYVYPKVDNIMPVHAPQPRAFSLPLNTQYDSSPDEPPALVPAHVQVLSSMPYASTSSPISDVPKKLSLPIQETPKKPLTLACFFCRKRKIACGRPPLGSKDRTCNQCARRGLKCEYPEVSRRGMRTQVDDPPVIIALC